MHSFVLESNSRPGIKGGSWLDRAIQSKMSRGSAITASRHLDHRLNKPETKYCVKKTNLNGGLLEMQLRRNGTRTCARAAGRANVGFIHVHLHGDEFTKDPSEF